MRHTRLYLGLLPLLGLMAGNAAWAQTAPPATQDDFGGVGLLQMPSARMAPDGNFAIGINRTVPYTRYTIAVQPLPWLEGVFRYTDISNRLYGSHSLSGDQSYKDKAVDVKVRLHRESRWWPALSVGARDIGGTGLFSGEYFVASKRWGAFDASLGLGWGYTGARGDIHNPFGWIDHRFNTRPAPDAHSVEAGKFNGKHFFRGPMALFGGIEYQTPWSPLSVKLEYDGNNYRHEPKNNNLRQDSPFNLGLVYRVSSHVDLTLGIERGNTALFGFSLHGDVGQAPPLAKPLDPPPQPAPKVRANTPPGKVDWAVVSRELQDNAGFAVDRVTRQGSELFVSGEQQRYFYPDEGVGRAARILDHALGQGIGWFTLVDHKQGLPIEQTSVQRQAFNKLLTHDLSLTDFRRNVERDPPTHDDTRQVLYQAPLKRYRGGFSTSLTESIGGPNAFVLYRLNANYGATYNFTRHLWLGGWAQLDVVDNYDKFTYDAPSNLPRVRTYVREYLTSSRFNIPNLQLTWARKLAPSWYGMAYAGLLESMYAGAGGEVLYRPFDSNFALGADVNWVRQRGFEQHFAMRDYHVVTGMLTAYIRTGFHHRVLTKLSAGRYLAGDWGGTIDVSRLFGNGVRMGVWATFTSADGRQFGEGSFDKGFYLTIPFDLMLPRSTPASTTFVWRPLIRDGGARLGRNYTLYGLTDGRDPQLFDANFGMITQ
ncbi:MAG TPA: YjbH domain-containing protein [Rhodanobacteraceae bacterium]